LQHRGELRAVATLLPHGYRFCVALFGIMESGAAIVPLDTRWPLMRLSHVAETCGVTTVVTVNQYHHLARDIANIANIILLDDPAEAVLDPVREPSPVSSAASDRYAYVVFTSGTSGHSKGVPISHDNLMPLLLWQKETFDLGPHLRSIQVLPVTFDFGLEEILNQLCFGGTLVVPTEHERLTPERYASAMHEHGATMLYATPTFMRQLLFHADFSRLRLLLIGGEIFDVSLGEAIARAVPSEARVFNGYGPTEVTITATTHRVSGRESAMYPAARSIPIGRPCAANAVYVLDNYFRPTPVGVPGEVYVGGPGVADGYVGASLEDEARFVDDVFSPDSGGRLYRTGDLARYLSDGSIEFIGRNDRQVKIRGYRVEPGEIAAVLARHPAVATVYVDVERDFAGLLRLVAYCSSVRASSDFLAELQTLAESALPAHMVPRLRVVDTIPVTGNGKVDVEALRRLAPAAHEIAPLEPSDGDVVGVVLAAWRRVLDRPDLRADDNVFEFGAHSLNVGNAHAMIRARVSLDFPLFRLFECYTARKLGESLRKQVSPAGPPGVSRGALRRRSVNTVPRNRGRSR
jgi:amino acid adenylation domain-containing protein